jgi:hypothetical protein
MNGQRKRKCSSDIQNSVTPAVCTDRSKFRGLDTKSMCSLVGEVFSVLLLALSRCETALANNSFLSRPSLLTRISRRHDTRRRTSLLPSQLPALISEHSVFLDLSSIRPEKEIQHPREHTKLRRFTLLRSSTVHVQVRKWLFPWRLVST